MPRSEKTKFETPRKGSYSKLDKELRAQNIRTSLIILLFLLLVVGIGAWSFFYRMPAAEETALTAVVTGHTAQHSDVGNLPYLIVALPSGDRVRVRRYRQPNHQIGDFVTVIESKRFIGTPRYRLVDSLR